MKANNGKGPAARTFCGSICIAAFTLAVLSVIPSCKNGSADEKDDFPAYSQSGQADSKSAGTPTQVAETPKTAETPIFPADAQQPAGQGTQDQAPQGQDVPQEQAPQNQESPQNEAPAKEQEGVTEIPKNEACSVQEAKAGYILLAGGEIVRPEYLAEHGGKGLEPIGIICFRGNERKMVVGIDAFYKQKKLYGPGSWKTEESLNSILFKTDIMAKSSGKFYYDGINSKKESDGNLIAVLNLTKRGAENYNMHTDYIAPYRSNVRCAGRDLDWQAPTLYEAMILACSRTRNRESIQAIIKFFDRIGDDRARLLEEGETPVKDEEYVLTSSSGKSAPKTPYAAGFWALRLNETPRTQADYDRFQEVMDCIGEKTTSLKCKPFDLETEAGIPVEIVLAKPDSDGFKAVAVAYLN